MLPLISLGWILIVLLEFSPRHLPCECRHCSRCRHEMISGSSSLTNSLGEKLIFPSKFVKEENLFMISVSPWYVVQLHFHQSFNICRLVINYVGTKVDRLFLLGFGFHWIHTRGEIAPAKDAPILVVSPHSCILDMFIVSLYRVPTFLARADIRKVPLFGCEFRLWWLLTHVVVLYSS